jgi:hypothetical protein
MTTLRIETSKALPNICGGSVVTHCHRYKLFNPESHEPERCGRPTASGGRGARFVASGSVLLDEADCIADSGDIFGSIIGDLDTEFFLERHDQLDGVQAVCAKIVDEVGFLGHLVGFDPEMLDDDLLDPFSNITHFTNTLVGWSAFNPAHTPLRCESTDWLIYGQDLKIKELSVSGTGNTPVLTVAYYHT